MRRGMSKPRGLEVRHYASRFIDLNNYLDCFPGATLYGKIGVTELNKFLFNSMPNCWSNQAYVQGFDCESISFKKRIYIAESIYEGVLEPSYKNIYYVRLQPCWSQQVKYIGSRLVKDSLCDGWECCQSHKTMCRSPVDKI